MISNIRTDKYLMDEYISKEEGRYDTIEQAKMNFDKVLELDPDFNMEIMGDSLIFKPAYKIGHELIYNGFNMNKFISARNGLDLLISKHKNVPLLKCWWIHLPPWCIVKNNVTHHLYPPMFKIQVFSWLLVNRNMKFVPKDVSFIIISCLANLLRRNKNAIKI